MASHLPRARGARQRLAVLEDGARALEGEALPLALARPRRARAARDRQAQQLLLLLVKRGT
jgi:hypothetical protein